MSTPRLLQPAVLIPFAISTLIWGSTWLVIRNQLGVVPPGWSITYRFLIGGFAMLSYAWFDRIPLRLSGRDALFAAIVGTALFFGNFNLIYRAEAHITSGLVAVVFALLIVPNTVFAAIFLKRGFGGSRFILGSIVALAGVGLLVLHEARATPGVLAETVTGVLLTLLGMVCASIANVLQASERGRAVPMAAMLAWSMLWGALLNAACAWTFAGAPAWDFRPSYAIGLLYLGLIASAVAFTLYFQVIRAVGPGVAAYSSILTPVLAMILSTIFEDYRWSVLAVAGGAISFSGLVIALSARNPTR